ncbi:energy transducer TonB, partial [Elizabethkingia meningoseptica]|uniref:energy transducer TonB n=1 Tax=Elizabethkingia meningoseptica TaxID=238 RepID=UPI001C885EEC
PTPEPPSPPPHPPAAPDPHTTKSTTPDYQKQTMAAETNYKKKFVYPSDYIKAKDNGSSYTSTQFLLMKDGTVSDVQAESVFSNSKNNIFEKLFNERAELYVKKFDWKPSTIQGIPVNSHMSMVVFYD